MGLDFFTFWGYKSLRLGVRFLTFGGYKSLRLGVKNSYVWRLQILTFGGYTLLRLGGLEVLNYYVCGLQILTLVVRFLTFGGLQIPTFDGDICYVLRVTNPYV